MAAAGKKGKKAKWIPANLTDFIAEPTSIATSQNWADSVEDEPENFGYASRTRAPVVLPSASRAARGGNAVDDDSIPRRPPYEAHISNLPYAVDESAISELFADLKVINLRLPREGDRLKGYGYVEFEDRESLISAMNIPELTIGGRRIRIEVSTQDNDRRMGRNNRSDRDREYDPERTMGDWRSGPRAAPENSSGPPRSRSDRDEGRDRDRDRDRGPMTREGMRERDSSPDNKPGGWRDGERPAAEPARTPYGGRDSFGRRDEDRGGFGGERRERGYGRDGERSGYGGRDGFRTAERGEGGGGGGGGGFGNRDRDRDSRGFGSRGFGDRDRERDAPPREESKPRERPKLNLLPRTVPREAEAPSKPADGAPADDKPTEKPAPKPVTAEKVFGAAKPVDTAAKEREIEERLRKQEEEARRTGDDKERWGRKNDHSDDRRGGARRDDRGRDTRPYNKDRRDISKDSGKDRRDYSKDSGKDRRDISKDSGKDRRDYSKDSDKDRHDYSKESDKDRHDYSKDNRDKRDHSRDKERPPSGERRRDYSSERHSSADRDDKPRNGEERARNGGDGADARASRPRDRPDDTERPLPKMKEQEKPNFVGSNKFSFLEDADDGGSD